MGLFSFNFFSGGLCKTFLLLQEWRFGRSRSSKVIDFGTNRKRVCEFLLVHHINFGPILYRFRDIAEFFVFITPPLFHPDFGVFSSDRIAHVGVNLSRYLKPFGRKIIFNVFQPMWSRYLNVTDRRTDGHRRTDDFLWHHLTLRSITRKMQNDRNSLSLKLFIRWQVGITRAQLLLW